MRIEQGQERILAKNFDGPKRSNLQDFDTRRKRNCREDKDGVHRIKQGGGPAEISKVREPGLDSLKLPAMY